MNKQTIPLAIFFVLVIFLAIGLTLDPKKVPSPLIGKPITAFELNELGSDKVFTPAQLQGEVWLLNIWASWCYACQFEHPLLVEMAAENRIKMVGLNYKDSQMDAEKWLQKHKNPYQLIIADPQGKTSIDLGVYGVPETFIIDQQGIIRHKFTGPLTKELISEELYPLLSELNQAKQGK